MKMSELWKRCIHVKGQYVKKKCNFLKKKFVIKTFLFKKPGLLFHLLYLQLDMRKPGGVPLHIRFNAC